MFAVDDIRALTGADIYTVVATAAQLQDTIDRFHRLDGEVDTMAQEAADELDDGDDLSSVSEIIEDAPIVKFVNLLITQAVTDRASDIHVEPAEKRPAHPVPHRRRAARGHALARSRSRPA